MANPVSSKSGVMLQGDDRFLWELAAMAAKHAKSTETFGERLARLRKHRAITQVELAEQVGLAQSNVSDYERDVFRPNGDMILRIAQALHVSTDELLGLRLSRDDGPGLSRKLVKRMSQIERLSARHQRALLQTIDTYLKGALA